MAKELNYKMVLAAWNFTSQGNIQKVLEQELKLSKHEISRLKFEGEILVNGKPVRVNDHMDVGDTLTVRFPDDRTQSIPVVDMEPEILYEDEDFVIVNKPSGLATHPSHTDQELSMSAILQSHYQKLGQNIIMRPIGRLDKEVSGIVLFAKNQPAAARLTEDRDKGKLKKKYTAIVSGVPARKSARIRMPIEKVEGQVERVISDEGKNASTTYRVREELDIEGEKASRLEVEIETGRTHQIRVHMNAIGHPLLGDSLYGGKVGRIKRPALHCYSIDLLKPFTREPVHVECPLPDDMQLLLSPIIPQEKVVVAPPVMETTTETQTFVNTTTETKQPDDTDLDSGSLAVIMPDKNENLLKYLWIGLGILGLLLLCFFGYRFIRNLSANRSEKLEEQRQEIYDSLVLEPKQDLIIEYGSTFHAESYFKEHKGKLAILDKVDTEKIGKQKIRFTLTEVMENGEEVVREFEEEFTVQDTLKPEIVFKKDEVKVLIGEQFKPKDNITKIEDPNRGLLKEDTTLTKGTYIIEHEVDETHEGEYIVTVKAMDLNGNTAEKSYKVTVGETSAAATPKPSVTPSASPTPTPVGDTTNPLILIRADVVTINQNEEYVVGQNIIYVRDDVDGDLTYAEELKPGTYTVKTNFTNKNVGEYTVIIDAMDRAGNTDHDDFVIQVLELPPTPAPTPTPTPSQQNSGGIVPDSSDPYNQIYTFLTGSMGMNRAQAIGVMANLIRESGLQPTADNGIGYYGLCQWGGGRQENLKNWCTENGYDYNTIDGQLHFMQMEIVSSYPNTYSQLMACEDNSDGAYWAGYIFGKGYEVAGEYYSELGANRAREMYDQ